MRKLSSTNYSNQQFLYHECELNYALSLVSGRWKAQVLMDIAKGINRFSRLKEENARISDQALSRLLRQLERDGLIAREEKNELPKRIDYHLTPKAVDFCLLLKDLCNWAQTHMPANTAADAC